LMPDAYTAIDNSGVVLRKQWGGTLDFGLGPWVCGRRSRWTSWERGKGTLDALL